MFKRGSVASVPTPQNMRVRSNSLQQTHFKFGGDPMVYQSHNMSCLLNPSPSDAATGEERQELKERMRKASFTLGLKSEGGQLKAQSMYKSCIDASAKLGGMPSNGELVKAEMKKTYIKIGEGNQCSAETEANTAFTTLT